MCVNDLGKQYTDHFRAWEEETGVKDWPWLETQTPAGQVAIQQRVDKALSTQPSVVPNLAYLSDLATVLRRLLTRSWDLQRFLNKKKDLMIKKADLTNHVVLWVTCIILLANLFYTSFFRQTCPIHQSIGELVLYIILSANLCYISFGKFVLYIIQ